MKATDVLESYIGERCRHCGENPPLPGWKCCRECWNQICRGGARAGVGNAFSTPGVGSSVAQPRPVGEPTQLAFDQEQAA